MELNLVLPFSLRRPYRPEGKCKLERWHRTFRDQFLSELDDARIKDLSDLNARLWS
jgi:putative transposase